MYISNGKLLQKNPSKEFINLSNLVLNSGKCEWIQEEMIFAAASKSDEMYIAFAAPSMTGKTQMAFAIESKIPLFCFRFFPVHIFEFSEHI